MDEQILAQAKRLLIELDGHLGLAIYRNEHDERWKDEGKELISRIRRLCKEMANG